ncbi:flavin reductase family protein [Pseudonocardia sp. ICBG1293]|uniref:flavin reductase family protein n=1 Tax=Pseudonocardia sp. ICBG1293 TaxID=2844382 RepID=UPI001CCDE3C7|nr:flavin reductase family protein [Pseudonocardia sp. ICBG1293]
MTGDETVALQSAFRTAMAGVCTPVSVITSVADGRPHGTTVSAFTSLSMSPPMVLVSLDAGSDLLALVRRTGTFGVNVLGVGQAGLALRFARKGADGFDDVTWSEQGGAARLAGSAAWVGCRVARIHDGGDHLVVLGDVLTVASSDLDPLTYHARTFGTHLPQPPATAS